MKQPLSSKKTKRPRKEREEEAESENNKKKKKKKKKNNNNKKKIAGLHSREEIQFLAQLLLYLGYGEDDIVHEMHLGIKHCELLLRLIWYLLSVEKVLRGVRWRILA